MCFVSTMHIITYLFMYIRGKVIKCRLKEFIKSFKKCMQVYETIDRVKQQRGRRFH